MVSPNGSGHVKIFILGGAKVGFYETARFDRFKRLQTAVKTFIF